MLAAAAEEIAFQNQGCIHGQGDPHAETRKAQRTIESAASLAGLLRLPGRRRFQKIASLLLVNAPLPAFISVPSLE
jgi:hypothetical protein